MDISSQAREGSEGRAALVPSSHTSHGGYFDSQPLRAGYFDMIGDEIRGAESTARDAVSYGELLQRELIKARIRGEIIQRELAQVRLLEEEVRRELKMERALAMAKRHDGLGSSFGAAPKASEDRVLSSQHLGKDLVMESMAADGQDRVDLFRDHQRLPVEKGSPESVLQDRIDHKKASPNVLGAGMVEGRSPKTEAQIDRGMSSAVLTFSSNESESLGEFMCNFSSQAREGSEGRAALVPSSHTSHGGYFDSQPLRAGYFDMIGDEIRGAESTRDAVSSGELLQRDPIKARIRGEIIRRELAQVRLLEEEVRRELKMERALAMAKRHDELGSSFGAAPKASEDRVLSSQHLGKDLVMESVAADGRDRVDLFRDHQRLPAEKGSPESVLQDQIDHKKASPNVLGAGMVEGRSPKTEAQIDRGMSSAVLTFSANGEQSTEGVGGTKRRASELPGISRKKAGGPAEHDWSCAICQVTATSRVMLNEHLEGRRHRAKAELMGIIKNTALSAASANGAAATTPSAVVKDTALKEQKTATLWCELCKVECNRDTVLASHLGGKKHRAMLEKSQAATTKTFN